MRLVIEIPDNYIETIKNTRDIPNTIRNEVADIIIEADKEDE